MAVRQSAFHFKGHFEKQDGYICALCDHAPVFVCAGDEDEALSQMVEALRAYLVKLVERDEIEAAVAAGRLIRRRAVSRAAAKRAGDRFDVQMAA